MGLVQGPGGLLVPWGQLEDLAEAEEMASSGATLPGFPRRRFTAPSKVLSLFPRNFSPTAMQATRESKSCLLTANH